MSVSSGGNCIRTYRPEIKKGTYNTIIVNVKTVVADNLLFYLGSAKFVSLSSAFLVRVAQSNQTTEKQRMRKVLFFPPGGFKAVVVGLR